MFDVKKFNSGEWDVKIKPEFIKKLLSLDSVELHWNWFEQPDIMIPFMTASAIEKIFNGVGVFNSKFTLKVPYLPYSRQDRAFEVGQGIYVTSLIDLLTTKFDCIETLCIHGEAHGSSGRGFKLINSLIYLHDVKDKIIVFPDKSADKHFSNVSGKSCVYLQKSRYIDDIGQSISSTIDKAFLLFESKEMAKDFLICDDICDGGRTFTECAKVLKKEFGENIKIELLVAHGFMTHGLDDLKKCGISTIFIANEDSYEYLTEKFNDNEYIKFWE